MLDEFLRYAKRGWMIKCLILVLILGLSCHCCIYYFIIYRPIFKINLNYDESIYSKTSSRSDTRVTYRPIYITEITKSGEDHLNWTSIITITRYKNLMLENLKGWVESWIYGMDLYKFNGKINPKIKSDGHYITNVEWVVNEGSNQQMQIAKFWRLNYDVYSVSFTEKPTISKPLEWKKSILNSYAYSTFVFD